MNRNKEIPNNTLHKQRIWEDNNGPVLYSVEMILT